jgi:hypothetical protein
MQRLVRRRSSEDLRHRQDAEEISSRLRAMGYDVSVVDCHEAWEEYSESMAASWMMLPGDDNHLLSIITSYLEEVE